MLIVDGIQLDPGKLELPRPNPKFDKNAPVSEENSPFRMAEVDAIVMTFNVHGGGGQIQVMFPRKHSADVRKGLRELEGVDIVEAKPSDMPKGPVNGAAS